MKNKEKKSAGFSKLVGENVFVFFLCVAIAFLMSWPFVSSFLRSPLHLIVGFFFSILILLLIFLVSSVIIDKKQ